MNEKKKIGKEGEDRAVQYLQSKKYKIIERNVLKPWGELDIVAIAPDKTLVFVEVKTMRGRGDDFISPENQMSFSKIKKFKKAAMIYAGANENIIYDEKGWRLDVVTLQKWGSEYIIYHYENIE